MGLVSVLTLLLTGLLLLLGVAYAAALSSWAVGFRRVLSRGEADVARNGHVPFVSVIVPARDEEATIDRCLESILACDYPIDRFEVIVVDDLSRDATADVVRRMIHAAAPVPALAGMEEFLPEDRDHQPAPVIRLLQMPESLERSPAHKKRAITRGIEAARGSIILTTDADCIVPRGWIREMASGFTGGVALVSGPVLYPQGPGLARRAQALEFLGLIAVGAGAIGSGRPNLCNGANVAYRRDVFVDVGGFRGIDHLTSGDDELLMQKIAYGTPWRVAFRANPAAAVLTEGAASIQEFFQQRKRWASKGRHYPHAPLRLTIAAIYAFYLVLLAGTIGLVLGVVPPAALAAAVALKAVPEAALLWPACRRFGRAGLMALFIPAQPLHVLYIVLMGAAGAVGGYRWKGRRIAR